MDNDSGLCGVYEQIELPPGFRFHPTDEELITHYLSQKVLDSCFNSTAIGDVDLNKVEPWDLPWKAKMGEREWYFFCIRDRKYPTGLRTNRATDAGYWKATGKDKEIYRGKALVGMKKTLVFYKGRAPKGSKTNWVMHEYRLEGKCSLYNLPKTAKNEWVISRIFQKNSSGKRTHISGLVKMSDSEDELQTSNLPPLMDCSSALDGQTRSTAGDTSHVSHVTCFSDLVEEKNHHDQMVDSFINPLLGSSSASKPLFPKSSVSDSPFSTQFVPNMENFDYLESSLMQDQSMMRFLVQNMKREPNSKAEFSNHEIGQRYFVGQEDSILSGGPVDLDCLWNY